MITTSVEDIRVN